jgi:hypothetical protein
MATTTSGDSLNSTKMATTTRGSQEPVSFTWL